MTQATDAIDISGGPGRGQWTERAEMALRMLDTEMEQYRKATDAGDSYHGDEHLLLAGAWAAIYTASTAAAGM